ncbi:MAG: hypothetical protein ABEJ40_08740 [Haloarculaceae archaeon]
MVADRRQSRRRGRIGNDTLLTVRRAIALRERLVSGSYGPSSSERPADESKEPAERRSSANAGESAFGADRFGVRSSGGEH